MYVYCCWGLLELPRLTSDSREQHSHCLLSLLCLGPGQTIISCTIPKKSLIRVDCWSFRRFFLVCLLVQFAQYASEISSVLKLSTVLSRLPHDNFAASAKQQWCNLRVEEETICFMPLTPDYMLLVILFWIKIWIIYFRSQPQELTEPSVVLSWCWVPIYHHIYGGSTAMHSKAESVLDGRIDPTLS